MPFIPRHVIAVRTYELDSFGHVNNAAYLHYLEEARSAFLLQIGLSFNDLAGLNVQLIIVEAHLRYLSALRYGDEIEVAGSFRDIKSASLVIDYTLTEKGSNRLVATAWTRGAFVDAQTGRPTRAPESMRAAFMQASA